jgi:hypothetical protein
MQTDDFTANVRRRATSSSACECLMACISCSATFHRWWSRRVASGEAGGLDVFA